MPELTRKSTSTDLTFVCPDLKSSPPMNTHRCSANSITPGTNVFCGLPLMYAEPSRIDATANSVDGETSDSLRWIESRSAFAESFRPGRTSQNRSVFAVHRTITCPQNQCHCMCAVQNPSKMLSHTITTSLWYSAEWLSTNEETAVNIVTRNRKAHLKSRL